MRSKHTRNIDQVDLHCRPNNDIADIIRQIGRCAVEHSGGYNQPDSGRTNATFVSNYVDRQYRNMSHKKPKVNMTIMPAFCSAGSCSCEICHMGKIKMAMSMVAWTRVVPKKNFWSSMAQYPPALESQNAWTGTQ